MNAAGPNLGARARAVNCPFAGENKSPVRRVAPSIASSLLSATTIPYASTTGARDLLLLPMSQIIVRSIKASHSSETLNAFLKYNLTRSTSSMICGKALVMPMRDPKPRLSPRATSAETSARMSTCGVGCRKTNSATNASWLSGTLNAFTSNSGAESPENKNLRFPWAGITAVTVSN